MRRTLSILTGVVVALAMVAPGVAQAHRGGHHPLLHPVHVEATFQYLDGTALAVIGDRGLITAVDATSLTLVRRDEVEVTVALSDRTCILVDGQPATWEALVVGEKVGAISQLDSTGGQHALVIRSGHPWFRPDRPNCGLFEGAYHADGTALFANGESFEYAWDKGRISGITPHRFRIERLDGESVTAAVNGRTHVFGARSYRALNLGEPVWVISLKLGGDPDALLARVINRIRP